PLNPSAPQPPGTWTAPAAYGQSEFRSLKPLTTALTVLFICVAVGALLSAGALLNRVNVLDDMLNGNIDLSRARSADSSVSAFAGITLLLTIAIIVVFIVWFHRAAKNNVALGRRRARYSPGWAIGGWFIPFANLVIPAQIAQDLWRGSDSTTEP